MREFDLQSFAAFCAVGGELVRDIEIAKKTALHAMAQLIVAEAKKVLGTYDYDWPQLAPSTQADRVQAGFAANEPLLRTGELRDSIEYTIISDHEAEVGSDPDLALFFVGEPEEKMLATLQQTRANLQAQLAQQFGPDIAAQIAAAFVKALIGRKAEIEAAGVGSRRIYMKPASKMEA